MANTAWAFLLCGDHSGKHLKRLLQEASLRSNVNTKGAMSLAWVWLYLKYVERVDVAHLEQCYAAWKEKTLNCDDCHSALEQEVAERLRVLFPRKIVETDRRVEVFPLDVAVDGKIDIEIDGPHHTTRDRSDAMRDRIISKLGWTVRRLDTMTWRSLGEKEQDIYLAGLVP